MMDAGKYWLQWKSKMAGRYIHKDNPIDHPLEKYADVITPEEWIEFQNYRTSDEFLERRRKNTNSQ